MNEIERQVNFTKEHIEKIENFIKTEWFKELNESVLMCNLNDSENEIIQQIKRYIIFFMGRNSYNNDFNTLSNKFINFLEKYSRKEPPKFEKDENGFVNLLGSALPCGNGYNIDNKFKMGKRPIFNGMYIIGTLVATNGDFYLEKTDMNKRELYVSPNSKQETRYNPILAERVFGFFNVPVASYMLANNYPYTSILSKNFLQKNQEMIGFDELYSFNQNDEPDTYSKRIEMLENNIKMRYSTLLNTEDLNTLVKKLKLQYCKQEFVKRVIGPMDANLTNTSIILTTSGEDEVPEINIAPAYDLDLSFNAADEAYKMQNMYILKCNNDKSDINSLMSEFSKIDGFTEFVKECTDKIKQDNICKNILQEAYEQTRYKLL